MEDKTLKRVSRIPIALLLGAFCFAFLSATASAQLVQKATGSSSTASVSATFTSTPASGNFLIAIVGAGNATFTQPSGWSTAINQGGASVSQAIFYKVAGSSEPTTVTVSGTGAVYHGLQIFEYQNFASVSLDSTNSNTGTGTTITTNSVTTSQATDLIVVGVAINANTSFASWTNSFVEQNDFPVGSGSIFRTFGGADFITSSAGTFSTGATAGSSAAWRAQIVAFKGTGGLPIQMASSAANVVRDNDVEVAWRTVSETNNYGFEIYRKRGESGEWKKIAFVEGHGTTLIPQSYSYVDKALTFGKYSYHIKQIDLDGKTESFPEMHVNVAVGPDKFVLTQNYPNPFNPSTVIEFAVPQTGFATMRVYNLLGQEVATLFEGNAEAGKIYTVRFSATGRRLDSSSGSASGGNASNITSGVYFYTLKSAGKTETKRMLLLK